MSEKRYVFTCVFCDEAEAVLEDADWHECDYCGSAPKACVECAKRASPRKWAPLYEEVGQ